MWNDLEYGLANWRVIVIIGTGKIWFAMDPITVDNDALLYNCNLAAVIVTTIRKEVYIGNFLKECLRYKFRSFRSKL